MSLILFFPFTATCQDYVPEMTDVAGGSFEMGSADGSDNERPLHTVRLSDFSLGKYEVTQEEWKAVMASNPSNHSGCDDCPVENVSYEEVQKYLAKINKMTGKNFRLPTEAEWEFAARGGNESKHYLYSGGNDLDKVAWTINNSSGQTHAVGKKKPNELGLYDMSGNVWEWVSDFYSPDFYINSPINNPTGSTKGKIRIVRGGSAYYSAFHARSTYRMIISPRNPHHNYGFRLALSK